MSEAVTTLLVDYLNNARACEFTAIYVAYEDLACIHFGFTGGIILECHFVDIANIVLCTTTARSTSGFVAHPFKEVDRFALVPDCSHGATNKLWVRSGCPERRVGIAAN